MLASICAVVAAAVVVDDDVVVLIVVDYVAEEIAHGVADEVVEVVVAEHGVD